MDTFKAVSSIGTRLLNHRPAIEGEISTLLQVESNHEAELQQLVNVSARTEMMVLQTMPECRALGQAYTADLSNKANAALHMCESLFSRLKDDPEKKFLEEGRALRQKELGECREEVQQVCQSSDELLETQLKALNDQYDHLEKELENS